MERYNNTFCKYCNGESVLNFAEVLECHNCKKLVHISCLKRQSVPGGIFGDTFFKFTCQECSDTGYEVFVREKMTWFQVIILILFHVQKKAAGTANKGFFHWRIHLVSLIDKKWNTLFTKNVKRRKNWMGTISGAISHFSPCFFTSGTPVLGSNGWWKLTFPNLTPTACIAIYNELTANKQVTLKTYNDIVHIKKFIRKFVPTLAIQDDIYPELTYEEKEIYQDEKVIHQDDKIDKYLEDMNVDVDDEFQLISPELLIDPKSILQHDLKINQLLEYVTPQKPIIKLEQDVDKYEEENFTQDQDDEINSEKYAIKFEETDIIKFEVEESDIKFKEKKQKEKTVFKPPPSLFKLSKTNFYSFWKNHERKVRIQENLCVAPLRTVEEEVLHNYMLGKKLKTRAEISLRRKLQVRNIKQKQSVKSFNTNLMSDSALAQMRTKHYKNCEIEKLPVKIMVHGKVRQNELFISPYANRLLKPLIRCEKEPKSFWLKLMSELMKKVSEKQNIITDFKISTLDYVYVQPNHIPTINSLCEQFFWPGIDLSETLEYPEFSCVVLYKKLVVAFGFMVPDVKFNETYISFIFTRPEWRREGIATFMIYHLIQTCMGKDITLHVAIDNPAIHLYQKFGFKVEEVVYNFYDTYLKDDVKTKKCTDTFTFLYPLPIRSATDPLLIQVQITKIFTCSKY